MHLLLFYRKYILKTFANNTSTRCTLNIDSTLITSLFRSWLYANLGHELVYTVWAKSCTLHNSAVAYYYRRFLYMFKEPAKLTPVMNASGFLERINSIASGMSHLYLYIRYAATTAADLC